MYHYSSKREQTTDKVDESLCRAKEDAKEDTEGYIQYDYI